MKSALSTIQSLHKLGRILSRIYFLLSIFIVIFSPSFFIVLVTNGSIRENIDAFLSSKTGYSVTTLYGVCTTLFITSFGEFFLSRKAEDYFKSELEYGTPFSLQNALKLKKLGIATIIIPLVTHSLSALAYYLISQNMDGMAPFEFHMTGSFALGIMFILTSLLCKRGAGKETN